MAVIKNNKTGMWEVRTYYKDLTGARKQKTKRGSAKKSEALEWERNFKLKEDQSISMSFKSFVDIYLTDLEPRIKRNTFLTKKHIIETKILPYFGKRKLDDIRTSDVIQWQNEIMKLKKDNGELFSPTYLKTIHNQLSAILNHAVNMYGLKDNVARKAGTMGKEENKEMEFWTQDEFQAFLECVADKPISYYAFEMLYWTGIREGELLALTSADFNFEKKTLRINKSYQRLEGKDVITDPKTPKSNRTIVMPNFLVVEMEDFISSLYGIKDDDRIFTISKSYLHHEMDRGAKLAGVKRIRIHGLRHSHISLLINMGFSALAIGERVGHGEPLVYKGYPSKDGEPCHYYVGGGLGILSRSTCKEGAYAFWEYCLLYHSGDGEAYYTRREDYADSMARIADEQYAFTEDGKMKYRKLSEVSPGDVEEEGVEWISNMTEEQRDKQLAMLEYVRADTLDNQAVRNIICEEAAVYFAGAKGLEDTCRVIQSRVHLYITEQYRSCACAALPL